MADPFTIAALAGSGIMNTLSTGAGIAGSIISNKKNFKRAQELQANSQAWLERMSNTAHQREVADLRAAGLNPILSALNGNGATVGSAGIGSGTNTESYGDKLQQHFQNQMQAMQTTAQAKLMKEQAETEIQQQHLIGADRQLKIAQTLTEQANSTLKNKEASWYDKKIAKELELVGSQIKLNYGINTLNETQAKYIPYNAQTERMNAITGRQNAGTMHYNAITGRKEYNLSESAFNVDKQQQEEYNKWSKKHPYLKSVDQTITRWFGGNAGGYAGGKIKMPIKHNPVGFR